MAFPILTVSLRYEHDVVAARQRAREIAAALQFDPQDHTRIATAVSEIARNALTYGRGGKVEFAIEGETPPQVLLVTIIDRGPGIPNLAEILAGQYNSATGMGLGILGARRLMDQFNIESDGKGGTRVQLRKIFSRRAPVVTAADLPRIVDQLGAKPDGKPRTLLEELQQQNRELINTLEELRRRQEELTRVNAELADTNRGVIALYAELDEKADHLRRADELKSRFLSNMSHEFRTPLNSILALSRLLLDRTDGDLTPEQEKQVGFMRKAAQELYELVNDLLDLAKVQAGKISVRRVDFRLHDLFGALRGMLRPLLVNQAVRLVFEEPRELPVMHNDEGKVSQILRNFISNALKFTQSGEIRVVARLVRAGERASIPHHAMGDDDEACIAEHDSVLFTVEDTGIGIARENQERIFQEFGQLENPIQRYVKGTGLGLPLSRKLAELLGGVVRVRSAEGLGSTFAALIPVVHPQPAAAEDETPPEAQRSEDGRLPILIVEDSVEDRLFYEKYLKGTRFQPIFAKSIFQARALLSVESEQRMRPAAVILDILLHGQDSWSLLAEFKREPATREIPVIVVTTVDDPGKGFGLGADAYALKPVERQWLLERLEIMTGQGPAGKILLIEDDEAHRYLLRTLLGSGGGSGGRIVVEAGNGPSGLELARNEQPAVILLDLAMPGMHGLEVLDRLKSDPATREIPVLVVTSEQLSPPRLAAIGGLAAGVIAKHGLSRWDLLAAIARALAAPSAQRPPSTLDPHDPHEPHPTQEAPGPEDAQDGQGHPSRRPRPGVALAEFGDTMGLPHQHSPTPTIPQETRSP
jgi:signal transduction histidine kinase/DNA-binding response OmpR family regulator